MTDASGTDNDVGIPRTNRLPVRQWPAAQRPLAHGADVRDGRSGPVAANAPTTPSRRIAEALRGADKDANPNAHQQLQPERQGRAQACSNVAVFKNALERDRRSAREKTAHIER